MGGRTKEDGLEAQVFDGFNLRPRGGANFISFFALFRHSRFQSTPPWGGEPFRYPYYMSSRQVSIHAPVGGELVYWFVNFPRISVSIHAPVGGRTPASHARRFRDRFQSTPPWGGELHRNDEFIYEEGLVSIHAPVGGRTDDSAPKPAAKAVSIHAPVGGRTSDTVGTAKRLRFQSTPPWGGEHHTSHQRDVEFVVSIHAPVGGRTNDDPSPLQIHEVSIHAPVGGRTKYSLVCRCVSGQFQSTPPWGGELRKLFPIQVREAVSIHAPVGGRTDRNDRPDAPFSVSIHAPVGGRTAVTLPPPVYDEPEFQSTPPWGGERLGRASESIARAVSIHAPVGGRTNPEHQLFSE